MNFSPLWQHDETQGAVCNPDETQKVVFFDLIPSDALFVVVKHLSNQPHSEFWSESVRPTDALTVLKLGDELSAVSREIFKSETIGGHEWYHRRDCVSFIKLMAPNLKRLQLNSPAHKTINTHHFLSLRALTFDGFAVDLNLFVRTLEACGGSLLELEIRDRGMTEQTIETIARYCESLQSLILKIGNFTATLEPIWKAIGSTLISLEGAVLKGELVHITHNCTGLKKLHLYSLPEIAAADGAAMIGLIGSLKSLDIFVVELDACARLLLEADDIGFLVSACPSDVSVHFLCEDKSDDIQDFIQVIGTRLRVLKGLIVESMIPQNLASSLSNIEEISLVCYTEYSAAAEMKIAESIFVERMPYLRKLRIRVRNDSKILFVIARSVTSLVDLDCSFDHDMAAQEHIRECVTVKDCGFVELLHSNLRLRYIQLKFNGIAGQSASNSVVDFVQNLKICPNLKQVTAKFGYTCNRRAMFGKKLQAIRDACVPLRNRSLGLSLNGIRFLPS